jgi:hypothetical protein
VFSSAVARWFEGRCELPPVVQGAVDADGASVEGRRFVVAVKLLVCLAHTVGRGGFAAAVTEYVTAALKDGGVALDTKLITFVRERLQRDPSGRDALEAAMSSPHDQATVQRLAELLDQRMRDDPVFAQRLRMLWSDAAPVDSSHHE